MQPNGAPIGLLLSLTYTIADTPEPADPDTNPNLESNYAEKLAIRKKLGLTNANFSLYDLRKLFYSGDNKSVSQNDAIRAYLQSQLGNTTTQSLNDLWRLFFISKGVTNQVSLSDMARYFFQNIGF